jgi:hypothetical protein
MWPELKVEDDYGGCSLEVHQKFAGVYYNLSYGPPISNL